MESTNNLKKIHLGEYQFLKSRYILKYLKVCSLTKNIPEEFCKKCLPLKQDLNLEDFLRKINLVLRENVGEKKKKAKSFEESRFLTAREILKRKIVSCGSTTTIFAAVLRKQRIPTKLVHGKIREAKRADTRHAWLKIYNPLNKKWIVIDPMRQDFSLCPRAYPVRQYQDWSELKKDYKKGKW